MLKPIFVFSSAVLASPSNINIKSVLRKEMKSHHEVSTNGIFTGIHATFSKGDYFSIEGILLNNLPLQWMPAEPENKKNDEDCILLVGNGTIADVRCSEVHPYFCYKEDRKSMIVTGCDTIDRESTNMSGGYKNNTSIKNFVEYLQIPSVQPNINYDGCVKFLERQSSEIGLQFKVYELVPTKPIVMLSWPGQNPDLPSILLNSHMDVVPVFEDSWTHPPFSGHIDEEGKIFARGSQDMKCVGIQYLEAVRQLKNAGIQLKRTLHICFVPDEEIGGHDGMKIFVHTDTFKALNVGFALDEGMAHPDEEFIVFNGERNIWQIHVICTGQPGHGSLLIPNTAGEKLRYIINKFMDLRDEQKKLLESNPKFTIGDVTTINMTQVFGGVQSNVVPEKLTVVFDCRLAITVDHEKFENTVKQWCKEAGDGVTYEFEQKNDPVECTKTDDSNSYWVAFKSVADKLNLKLDVRIFPGGTDSRYVRGVGIPAIGFSPMNHTPVLLHDHDEFLKADIFLKGIDIYTKLIPAIANV